MPALIVILCASLCVYFLADGCPLRVIDRRPSKLWEERQGGILRSGRQ
jgi:hypothetical protein